MIVDLISIPETLVEYVRDINEKTISKHLIAIHDVGNIKIKEALIDTGAYYCFSIDPEPEELLKFISRLNHS
ncbi:hypothetical protein [Fodinibius sp. SL11]|uniref:hypothetical protein n=1 Tax=Fodinibius sp. SL11 TaxID=3425690 RepID=UPI003F884ACA